jgi:hypothetical protein
MNERSFSSSIFFCRELGKFGRITDHAIHRWNLRLLCIRLWRYSMSLSMTKDMNPRKFAMHTRRRGQVKQRRTFTLSADSIALLEELSARRNVRGRESVSSILDELLLAIYREKVRQENENRIANYYDERPEAQRHEELEWGRFAMAEFAAAQMNKGTE